MKNFNFLHKSVVFKIVNESFLNQVLPTQNKFSPFKISSTE